MKNFDNHAILLWAKRLLIYFCGLYCIAIGVAFSAKSGLGVSPVGSPANVLYQIGLDMGMPSYVNLGNCTIVVYCLYILAQILLLRRKFQPVQFLQLAVSFAFGWLVNLATAMLAFLPLPENYIMRMVYLLVNIPFVGLGVMLYLCPSLIPTPGEGVALAISNKTNLPISTCKTIFDCSVVTIAVILSLVYFKGLVGVREGTVICALLTGSVMRLQQKWLQKPVMRFVER